MTAKTKGLLFLLMFLSGVAKAAPTNPPDLFINPLKYFQKANSIVTQPAGDNSNNTASTAYVDRGILNETTRAQTKESTLIPTTTLNTANGPAKLNASLQVTAPVTGSVARTVIQRGPTALDDSNHGYAAGNLWNVPGLGMWICVDATVNDAVWTPVPTGILPLDSVPGVTMHGYGTRRLSVNYTGALLTVGSTDIGYGADNNINIKAIIAAIGAPSAVSTSGASPQTWSGNVTKWYDQTASTTILNLTVPTNYQAPQISPLFQTGGSPHIAFASGGANYLTNSNTTQIPRLSVASIPFNSQAAAVYTVARSASNANVSSMVALANSSGYPLALVSSYYAPPNNVYGNAAAMLIGANPVNTNVFVPQTPSVLAMNSTSSAITLNDDDNGSWSGSAISAISETSTSDILVLDGIDTSSSNGIGDFDINAVIYTNTALTAAQQLALRESLTDTFNLTPQVRDRIIVAGASTEVGAYGWMGQNPAAYAAQLGLIRPYQIYNQAVGGQPLGPSSKSTSTLALFSNIISPLYRSYGTNLIFLGAGSAGNSFLQSRTDTQTEADFTSFQSNVTALGSNVKLITSTVMPANGISPDSYRTNYNTWLSTQGVPYMDLAGQTLLGATSITSDRTMTYSDGIHHTPYYQSMEGGLMANIINAVTLSTITTTPNQ